MVLGRMANSISLRTLKEGEDIDIALFAISHPSLL
jgi:hypothetical protein